MKSRKSLFYIGLHFTELNHANIVTEKLQNTVRYHTLPVQSARFIAFFSLHY